MPADTWCAWFPSSKAIATFTASRGEHESNPQLIAQLVDQLVGHDRATCGNRPNPQNSRLGLAAIVPVARFLNASRISSDMNFLAVLRSRLASSFAAESTSSSISRVVRIDRSRPTRGGDHIPLVKRALIPIRNAVLHLASSGHGTVAGARRRASGFRRDKRL